MATTTSMSGAQFDALPYEEGRRLDPDRTPIPGAPDIAIEVLSPSERASDSYDKVRTYLRNGTSEVWQVYPRSQTVQIHRMKGVTVVESNQEIVSDLLPNFSLAVATLFS